MQMSKQDPWSAIERPQVPGYYTSKRVGPDENPMNRDVYWARGYSGEKALSILCHGKKSKLVPPSLYGMKARDTESGEGEELVIELVEDDAADMFLRVCIDVIEHLQKVDDKRSRDATILRLVHWSRFFKAESELLSPERQKGLIAELLFIQRVALRCFTESDALDGWHGPLAANRDFEYGQEIIEVKSKRGSDNPYVHISNEFQLNINSSEDLHLYVVEINSSSSDEGFSLTDVVSDTRNLLESSWLAARFNDSLESVGYFDEQDYSSSRWSEGMTYCYVVLDDFPKVASDEIDPAISRVGYRLDLDYCEKFKESEDALMSKLGGDGGNEPENA